MFINYKGFAEVDFSDLVGKTITKIDGLRVGSETVKFHMSDGDVYQMNYYPD